MGVMGETAMSDAAFLTAKFPGMSTEELRACVKEWRNTMQSAILVSGVGMTGDVCMTAEKAAFMQGEIARRERVEQGDVSAMTIGERLRFYRRNGL